MRPPGPLDLVALDFFRTGPSFRRPQHDHRPSRTDWIVRRARGFLNRANLTNRPIEGRRHLLMHLGRFAPLDEVWGVAVAVKQRLEFLMADSREQRRVRD